MNYRDISSMEKDSNGWNTNLTVSGNITVVGTKTVKITGQSWSTFLVGAIMSPIIILGLIGNIFSLLVWIKGRRRKTSTARFLSALAVADMLVLCTSGLEFWIGYVFHVDIRISSRFLCKFFYYLAYVGPSVSAWILVSVTVERALSVWIPHKITLACRPVTALIVVILTVFILLVLYLPFLVGVDVIILMTNSSTWMECNMLSGSALLKYLNVWLYMDLSLFFIIPFAIIILCNSTILSKVVFLANKRKKSLHAQGQKSRGKPSKAERMLKTVTVRIVVLSVTYCLCTGPISVLNTLLISPSFTEVVDGEHVQYLRIPFHLLMYLNNGINFFLYCFIGSGFRKDLIGIFRPGSWRSTSS